MGGGQSAVPVLVRRRSPGEASVALALPWQPSAGQVTVQISGVNAQDHT